MEPPSGQDSQAACLADLIAPVQVSSFYASHWGICPLFVRRADPAYYTSILAFDDIDTVLSSIDADTEKVCVCTDGSVKTLPDLVAGRDSATEMLYQHYRDGSTIIINSVERRWLPLQRLAAVVGRELSAKVQANVYLTPAKSQGFTAHYDTHDVFVLQVYGAKRWMLAASAYELPMPEQQSSTSLASDPEQEVVLQEGDLLYMPRGTVHWAVAEGGASAHVTLGIHQILIADAVSMALQKLYARDIRFRRALPAGFASDGSLQDEAAASVGKLLGVIAKEINPRETISAAVRKATSMGLPTLRHHLTDLEELDHVDADTLVLVRPEQRLSLASADGKARLHFHSKEIDFPTRVTDELQYIADSEGRTFCGNHIPGSLSSEDRAVLIRTLLREGLLTLASPDSIQ